MSSAKNILQEYYQKKQGKLPQYASVNMCELSHKPEWRSQVTTSDGITACSGTFTRKTHAENDAAAKCMALIKKRYELKKAQAPPKYAIPSNPNVIVLIDLENVQSLAKIQLTSTEDDLRIIGVVGKYNRGILQRREWLESVMELVEVETTGSDVADHALTFYAGTLAQEYFQRDDKEDMIWLVLSSDHFAAVPVEFLRKFGFTNTHSVTMVSEIKKYAPTIELVH